MCKKTRIRAGLLLVVRISHYVSGKILAKLIGGVDVVCSSRAMGIVFKEVQRWKDCVTIPTTWDGVIYCVLL